MARQTMSRMTYMRSWKSQRLTSHTWLGLNPQIGRPLSKIVVSLVYLFFPYTKHLFLKYSDIFRFSFNKVQFSPT
jgi:hypothetical protein